MNRGTALRIALPMAALAALALAGLPSVSVKRAPRPEPPLGPPPAFELPAKISFNEHVRPVLAENCLRCHGLDSAARKADLRLDRPESAFAKRANGKPVIVAGDPAASAFLRRITSHDPDERMPPPKSRKSLKPAEIALLERWIREGAEYQEHWAFIKPERPPLPDVQAKDWPRNAIDRFVLARLEPAGLAPAPEADRRALIRRVTLDLIGLPPRPEDVDAFVRDAAPDAYDKLVDRLLADTRWGEHRARYWLDYARYADTHGYHFDNYRNIWPYRDWVIRALNDNLPFDRFTIEQLAGDLLPEPTLEQRVATGFNRCAMSTNEGGVIAEEYEAIYAKDRVETTGAVWLGLTVGCATCHDHKFDPISQKEFYQLTAFFRNTTQPTMDGNIQDTPPVVRIPRPEDRERLAALAGEIERAQKAFDERLASIQPEFQRWLEGLDADSIRDVDPAGLAFRLVPDAEKPGTIHDLASGRTFTVAGKPAKDVSPHGPAVKLPEGTSADLGALGDVEADQAFSYGAWVKVRANAGGAIFARMDQQDAHKGWDLWTQDGRAGAHIISRWNNDALKAVAAAPLPAGKWSHVFVTYDGSRKVAGLKVYYNGVPQETTVEADALTGSIRTKTPLRLGQRSHGQGCTDASVHDARFYARLLPPEEVLLLAQRARFQSAAKASARTPEQLQLLRDYYVAFIDAESDRLKRAVSALQAEKKRLEARATPTLVTQEKKDAEPFARVLIRGQYERKGERVGPGVPKVLPPLPQGAPANRLGLAQWLLSPEHPLCARVNVNRFWGQVFGTGIVRTAQEFGTTGERPVNPPLLDWLAVEFRESGWDMKRFFRLMVTSAAYRQSAVVTPEKREKDPENRLLSRGPRFRMDGEMIRDLALAASGLLVDRIGGPSVKVYQPPGLWEAVAMEESNTRAYTQDMGDALHRRSLYTFWKRAAPHPAMETFNAPTREECCVNRERTNTPLQALVAMNDPQFVEAARHLAARAVREGGADAGRRLDAMAMRVLSRPLGPREREAMERGARELMRRYEADPKAAEALLRVGERPADASATPAELAAWTLVASQFFNLDEALNK